MKKQVRISILSNILNSKRNAPLCHGQRKLKTCAWSWFMAALAGSLVFPSADRSQRRALCTLPAFRSHTGEIEQALYSHAAGGISAAWTLADRGLRYPASGSITSASYPAAFALRPVHQKLLRQQAAHAHSAVHFQTRHCSKRFLRQPAALHRQTVPMPFERLLR